MANPYQKYKDESILSMSQSELLLLCYDEAITSLKKAEIALEDKDYDLFDEAIGKAGKIVRYLTMTLNMEQPLSHELKKLYNYVNFDLGRLYAGRERRKDELPALIQILSDLRDGFREASLIAGNMGTPHESKIVG
ncbi:MAG: flagellar protein FliS [[Clostridium] aminophilum]|uniref:flagellar export chaperone FliS n=1 Tax=[Clostridium] aminophilum TaxID=1526 RepID=UPI0026EDD4D0|nr:flagellar export chaperone FliS [[Clostridium] aminophilum]MDD6196260.1 flagellar protein FliS [[Clostridium] aminophilum]